MVPKVRSRLRAAARGRARLGGLALASVLGLAAGSPPEGGLPLAAGPRGGFYLEVAEGVAAAMPSIRPVVTAGSVENLRLLEEGKVRYALVQQDVVSEHLRERPEGAEGRDSRLRVVGRVFFDDLHIFVRTPLHVGEPGQLSRFLIWPGDQGSGTRRTAVRFLESVGVPLSSLARPPVDLDAPPVEKAATPGEAGTGDRVSRLEALFGAARLDVAMLVSMPGSDAPCRLMAGEQASLYPLDYPTLRLLTAEQEVDASARQITIATIPAGTYPHQERAVPTVGVPVLLVTGRGESPGTAARVLGATRATWKGLAGTTGTAGCRRPAEEPPALPLEDANLRMLEGLAGPGPPARRRWWIPLIAGLLGLGLLGGVACLWRRGVGAAAWAVLKRERVANWIFGSLAVGVLSITGLTYAFEHGINENFSTPWESAWSITMYVFSGLENRTPYTPAGRVVAALGLVLGPLFFAFLTGWLARLFLHWEKGMPQNLTGHILILNWSERARRILGELHHPLLCEKNGAPVVVVLSNDARLSLREIRRVGGEDAVFEDFFLSLGDPTTERALLNAKAEDARAVVLLADDRAEGRADERSLRSLLMLRRIALNRGRDDLHVVVELTDAANVPVVGEMARDFPGLVEWVAGLDVRTRLIAQAAQNQGILSFYDDLLRVSDDTNEVYLHPIPAQAVGETFRAYAARILGAEVAGTGRRRANPVLPVGVERRVEGKRRVYSNPRPGSPGWVLAEGDRLVLLAYEPPGEGDLPRV